MQSYQVSPVAGLAALDFAEQRRRLKIDAARLQSELAAVERAEALSKSGLWGQVDLGSLPNPRRLREQLDEIEAGLGRFAQIEAEQAREAAEQAEQAEAQRREAANLAERNLVEARMAYDRAQAERLRCAVAGDLADYMAACESADAALGRYEAAQQAAEEVNHG